jgi:hypothetical protein
MSGGSTLLFPLQENLMGWPLMRGGHMCGRMVEQLLRLRQISGVPILFLYQVLAVAYFPLLSKLVERNCSTIIIARTFKRLSADFQKGDNQKWGQYLWWRLLESVRADSNLYLRPEVSGSILF